MGCDAVDSGIYALTFQNHLLSPSPKLMVEG